MSGPGQSWSGSFEWLNITHSEPEYDPIELSALMAEGKSLEKAKEILRERDDMKRGWYQAEYTAIAKPKTTGKIAVLYRKTP